MAIIELDRASQNTLGVGKDFCFIFHIRTDALIYKRLRCLFTMPLDDGGAPSFMPILLHLVS